MSLDDVTNVPASSSRGRSPGIFLRLPQEYVMAKTTCLGTLPSSNKRRAQGEKNVDLWTEGCLYPKDPSLNVHLPFTNIPSLLQYVGNGEQGLLGYCKRLNRHEIAWSEIYLHHWQLLNGIFHNLQDQMQTATSALEEAKSTIATKEKVIKKLEDTLSNMKSTSMGGRVSKQELSELQTLAPLGGARKQRVTAMRNFIQETSNDENALARASLLRSCFNKEDFIGMLDAPEAKHLKDTITKRVSCDFSNIVTDLDVQDICDAVGINTKGYQAIHQVLKDALTLVWVRADLEDKVEIFTQALVKEALVSHLEDLENADDDEEGDGDKDKDDHAYGTTTKPPPPPLASQTKPPVSKEIKPEHRDATGTIGEGQLQFSSNLLTYKKRIIALVSSVKEKETATSSADGSLTDINPWVNKEFRLAISKGDPVERFFEG
ncbi:hypothetical protein L7F22_025014 [Adiantum nelumboides]|nr:hypothetical protein [Adiantum nelumboides]